MEVDIDIIKSEYLKRCRACLTPTFKFEYYILADAARNYGEAIRDILGGNVWLDIIEWADNCMPVDTPTLAGIPINPSLLETE